MTAPGATIAITGASGFIGSVLVERLSRSGQPIVAMTRRTDGSAEGPHVTRRQVSSYSDEAEVARALEGCGCVVHLAGAADRRTYASGSADEAAVGAAALARAMTAAGVPRLILASSVYAAYAESGKTSYYGSAKLATEQQFALAKEAHGLLPIILRLPPVYGAGSRGPITKLAKLVRAGVPLPLGAATHPRPLLAAENLVDLVATLHAADAARWQRAAGRVYYPTDPRSLGLADLTRHIAQVTARRARLLWVPGVDRIIGRHTASVAGVNEPLLSEDFGWRAPAELAETLVYLRESSG